MNIGADINIENNDGETPLFYACKSRNEAVIKYLVEELEIDINKENKVYETPLFNVCEHGNEHP